jgi:hypothetical protein
MNQLLTAPEIFTSEVPVQLEQLDTRLKAIVRLKLREFIHLTPVFQDIPSISVFNESIVPIGVPMRINGEFFFDLASASMLAAEPECPHRPMRISPRRRMNRAISI